MSIPDVRDTKIGVIVGRFQAPELTEDHKGLIETAARDCSRVAILIGRTNGGERTAKDPLSYRERHDMIWDWIDRTTFKQTVEFGMHLIQDIEGENADRIWCKNVLAAVGYVFPDEDHLPRFLYGGRSSFLTTFAKEGFVWDPTHADKAIAGAVYSMPYESPNPTRSATAERRRICETGGSSAEFLSGVIYGVTKKEEQSRGIK